MFKDGGHALLWLTRALIASSNALREHSLSALLLLVAGLAVNAVLLRRPRLQARWHALQLRLPGLGGFIRAAQAERFISTLAILGRSGEPLVESLGIAASLVGNQAIRQRMQEVAECVRQGGNLSTALERSGDLPPMMLHMIASGERSGALDEMLAQAARQQATVLAGKVGVAVQLFEPAMLVFMGAVVMAIVMAILQPILGLNQLVM